MCKWLFLCDKGASSLTPSFVIVFAFLKEAERKWKILEDEKRNTMALDESSSEQQFRKLNSITFLCKKLEPYS